MDGAEPGEDLPDRAALIIVPDLGAPASRIGEFGAVQRRTVSQIQHRSGGIDHDPMDPEKAALLLEDALVAAVEGCRDEHRGDGQRKAQHAVAERKDSERYRENRHHHRGRSDRPEPGPSLDDRDHGRQYGERQKKIHSVRFSGRPGSGAKGAGEDQGQRIFIGRGEQDRRQDGVENTAQRAAERQAEIKFGEPRGRRTPCREHSVTDQRDEEEAKVMRRDHQAQRRRRDHEEEQEDADARRLSGQTTTL